MYRKLASPLLILLVWELASRSHLLNPLIAPPPSTVAADILLLIRTGTLFVALSATFQRIIIGFAIATVISVLLGTLMARFRIFEDLMDPVVELIRPVSPLAIFPLAILWFGIGDASKIFLIALSCSFPIILNTYAGVRSIDVSYIRAARSLGANSGEILAKVVLPASLPQVFTGVRIAWGIALIVIIASEMIGATEGLGYMVLEAQQTFRVERVFAGIVIIGVLGFATDRALRALSRWLLPWHRELRE
jgi:ABC-type nitrate/sulfonate/bicarbonate transport system permease component